MTKHRNPSKVFASLMMLRVSHTHDVVSFLAGKQIVCARSVKKESITIGFFVVGFIGLFVINTGNT